MLAAFIVSAWVLVGPAPRVAGAAVDQEAPEPLSPADANDLIQRRCHGCHTGAQAKGGLNLETFDAAAPDPAVARLMLVKIEMDQALFAAGKPTPSGATVAAMVAMLRVATLPNDAPSAPWKIDLEEVPARGHPLVSARTRSGAGELRFTCNGATRTFRAEAAPGSEASTDFSGLSPIVRRVFAWCLTGPQPSLVGTP
ncbi:MAG: c-type cytochrome domain-containing protein [Vicinamibacterales bacterium]